MQTATETIEKIGSTTDGRGGRRDVDLVHWGQRLTVRGIGLAKDYKSRSAAIKFAKKVFAHPSCEAEWLV